MRIKDGVAPLVVGSGNVIAVVVTAQDGQTTKTYTVTVTRAGSADANAECAVAEWVDVDAGLCVGDYGVHGVGGASQ